jgi:D-alanine-D-alanine ligase
VLAPAEIVFQDYGPSKVRVVGYRAKWISDSFEYANTPRRFDFPSQDSGLLDEMAALAVSCWKLFDLRGWARVDFRVDGSGCPWILEINANPCLSSDAGFMAAVRRSGLEPAEAIHRIVGHAGLTQRAWPPSPCCHWAQQVHEQEG